MRPLPQLFPKEVFWGFLTQDLQKWAWMRMERRGGGGERLQKGWRGQGPKGGEGSDMKRERVKSEGGGDFL